VILIISSFDADQLDMHVLPDLDKKGVMSQLLDLPVGSVNFTAAEDWMEQSTPGTTFFGVIKSSRLCPISRPGVMRVDVVIIA
jgi:hypothetical protein